MILFLFNIKAFEELVNELLFFLPAKYIKIKLSMSSYSRAFFSLSIKLSCSALLASTFSTDQVL